MITMSTIRTAVQDEFKINIKRKTRRHIYVVARTVYFKLCRDYTNFSLQRIGTTLQKTMQLFCMLSTIYLSRGFSVRTILLRIKNILTYIIKLKSD